jgi:hypothetical protein
VSSRWFRDFPHETSGPTKYAAHFKEGAPSPIAGEVNETAFAWAREQLPFFEVGDPDILAAYYFRVKTYRSHHQDGVHRHSVGCV